MTGIIDRTAELVPLAHLKDHPRNYRTHPEDQLEQLTASLQEHGVYRNVVVANDNTILAGHGVVLAAKRLGMSQLRVVRLPVDPESPAALRVLVGDNEIEHLAEQDDRLLSELLKELSEAEQAGTDPVGLAGTGYDEGMLANLAMVTRPAGEIRDFNEAQHWVGMPEYGEAPEVYKLIVSCPTEADRQTALRRLGMEQPFSNQAGTWTAWYPPKDAKEDLVSLRVTIDE